MERVHIAQIPNDALIQFGGSSSIMSPRSSIPNLALHFDNCMIFDIRISHICKKIVYSVVNHIKNIFNKNSRITVIQTLVFSKINYGLKVCVITMYSENANFATKVTLGGTKFGHVAPYLRGLKWLKEINKNELRPIVCGVVNRK